MDPVDESDLNEPVDRALDYLLNVAVFPFGTRRSEGPPEFGDFGLWARRPF
jgi:hypothetical protein